MGIVHTPRTIAAVLKGLRLKGSLGNDVGFRTPHKYQSRVGLFDVDYLGHMNNAAVVTHAEYARWQMSASTGFLHAGYRSGTNMVMASMTCRYRAELRPLFRKFEVETSIVGFDERHMWFSQKFRYPKKGDNRLRAHVVSKTLMIKGREVVDPRVFVRNELGVDQEIIDAVDRLNSDTSAEDLISHMEELDARFRDVAALDDEQRIIAGRRGLVTCSSNEAS